VDNDVAQAIRDLWDAQQAHDAAFAEYGGYSWGWAGGRHIEAVERCKQQLDDVLNAVIDARVQKALEARRG
jgi:hypothetical protein